MKAASVIVAFFISPSKFLRISKVGCRVNALRGFFLRGFIRLIDYFPTLA
jgi:hypothetical protein